MKNFEFKVRFSDTDDRQLSSEELEALAVVWEGVVENGDILTNIYPEDVCDDNKYFPVSTDWIECCYFSKSYLCVLPNVTA